MGCVGSKNNIEELRRKQYEDKEKVRHEVSFQKPQPFELVVKKVEEVPQQPQQQEKSNISDKPQWENREFLGLPQQRQQVASSQINIIYSSDKQDLPNLSALTRLQSSPIPSNKPQILPISIIQERPGQQNASGINSSPPKQPIKQIPLEQIEVQLPPPPPTLREINEIIKENSQLLSKQNPKSRLGSFMNLSSMSSENKKGDNRINIEQQIDPFAFIAIPRIEISSLIKII